MKRDLESILEEFSVEYPKEMVYTKLFEVTMQLGELFNVQCKQASQSAEIFAT